MTLEDEVEKLFAENPDLSEDEAVKRLKEMKDTETNKSLWKSKTIRNRVYMHLRKKEGEAQDRYNYGHQKRDAVHVESPVETKGSRSDLKIEGKEIAHHKPKDPFAIKPEGNVEEKVDQMKVIETAENAERFKKGIVDDVSRRMIKQVSTDAKSFRDEIISIISGLVAEVRNEFTEIKKEISNLRTHGIPTYEPIAKYDDLELRESTIDAIQKNTEEKELKEESDYVDSLIENEREYTSVLRVYHKLVDLAKEAKNGVQLRLFYENDKLSYDKKPVGWFGINPKHLIAGIAIGIPIGIAIWLICTALTAVPPPIP